MKRDIIINLTKIKEIIKKYVEQLYANTLDNSSEGCFGQITKT